MAKRPDLDAQAQALLYAAVHGDDAACARFKLSGRSLRRYREIAREGGSDLANTVRRYAEALDPEMKAEREAVAFGQWLLEQVRAASGLLLRKADAADSRSPETLRALNEHVGTLLDHQAALTYIERAFGGAHGGPDGEEDGAPAAGEEE